MSSAVTGKGVPVKGPRRLVWSSALRFARMAVAFVVVAGSLGLATVAATAQDGGGSCPSDGAPAYSDVPEGSFAYDDSRCLRELGISDAGDAYRPGDDMTRSEMAAFMANAYEALTGMEAPIEDHMFEDIADDPNADDIARISPNGLAITTGTTDTTYSPDDPVIRGHMALFLTRLYKAVAGADAPAGTTPFTDTGERSEDQRAAIGQIYNLMDTNGTRVTTGTSDTTFSPSGNVTREQMASFVARMYRVLDALAEAPGAPTGVAVAVSGDEGTALDVSWTAPEESGSDDITGYVVQWKSGDDDYSDDNQMSVDDAMAGFDDLTKGTSYTFRVAAVSDAGTGDWSDEASGSPGTVPGAVSDFRVVAGSASGTLVLTWAAPADDGGTPVTGYAVQWATGRNPASMEQIDGGSATTYTITGLMVGVNYSVNIQAVNGAGSGTITAPADTDQRTVQATTSVGSGSVKVVLPGADDQPGLRAGGKFAAVTWLTPTLGTGQNLVDFDIQRKCGTEEFPATHTGDRTHSQPAATPAVAVQKLANTDLLGGTGTPGTLTNGEACTYRVRANTYLDKSTAGNTAGQKDTDEPEIVGAWVEGSGTPLGAPGTPVVAEEAVEVANKSLKVSWSPAMTTDTPPKVNDGGSAITGYKISWASPADSPIGDVTVSATSTSHTIAGLTNGLQYTVTVQAINARGTSAASTARTGVPAAVPAAPGNVKVSQPPAPAQGATDQRGNILVVTWSAPAGNSTGAVTGYVVQRRTSVVTTPPEDAAAAGTWEALATAHTGTGTMVNDSIASENRGTSYDYRVRATNATGSGPWSTFGSGAAAALPGAVVAANIEVIPATGSLVLTWTAAAGNGSDVTHYNVRYALNSSGTEAWSAATRVTASALPNYTISGLSNGSPYVVGITAVNAVGSSAESVTPGDDTPVLATAAPSSVTAVPSPMENTDGAKLDVTWSAVANVVAYQIQYRNVAETTWSTGSVTPVTGSEKTIASVAYSDAGKARKVTVTGLTQGQTYVVRVRAVTQRLVGGTPQDAAILGAPRSSDPVEAEGTPETAPGTVAAAQPAKTTTIRVTWEPPEDAVAEGVTGYKVTWYPTASTVTGNRGNATVAADAKSYDITGLTAIGQGFTVTVAAVNKIGVGMAATVTHTLTAATTE